MAEVQTPADRVAEAYRIWAESRGSVSDQWMDLIHDQIEMRTVLSDEIPDDLSGSRISHDAVRNYFQAIARDWEMLEFDVDRIVDGGDDVVMVGRCAWRNRATGRVIDTSKVDVWHFEEGHAVSFL